MDAPTAVKVEPGSRRELVVGGFVLALALAPALGAIAWVPEFSTQDGPAHLYNARILNASLRPDSPFSATFEIAWQPMPNWSGHLATMALVNAFRPDVAGRLMTALTLVGFAGSIFWLRWVVAGGKGLATAAILAVLLALNVTWLLGFTGFLIGAALMPATLAVWWQGREWFGAARTLGLSLLLVLGYFSHPVSLGLTVVGLGVLAVLTPGVDRVRRGIWTAASLLPMVPLGLAYRSMTRLGGGLVPVWDHLKNPFSVSSWVHQLGWIDPLSLAAKTYQPFSDIASAANRTYAPAIWGAAAVALLALCSWRHRAGDRRAWLVLAVLLMLGGALGPDTLGVRHGHYLPQRVALLGLVALVPWLNLSWSGRSVRLGSGLLVIALGLQSLFVWGYAFDCRKSVGSLLKAGPAIGTNRRVGTLLVGIKGRFRSNPTMHADCLLGVSADNVIWNNYETAHYYFPVKVRPGIAHPSELAFERIALLDAPGEAAERADRWADLLAAHRDSIDVIVEWSKGPTPQLDTINGAAGYRETFRDGPIRVWTREESVTSMARGPR